MELPVSVKGVLFIGGRVPLLMNERAEWELPGGRPSADEAYEACVVREIKEELGIDAVAHTSVDDWVFEVIPGRKVHIITFLCQSSANPEDLVRSDEHSALLLADVANLAKLPLPSGYRRSIEKAWSMRKLTSSHALD
jgi:8-oxo-dGTP pyrophosphatase MutT (NUDIX family)